LRLTGAPPRFAVLRLEKASMGAMDVPARNPTAAVQRNFKALRQHLFEVE